MTESKPYQYLRDQRRLPWPNVEAANRHMRVRCHSQHPSPRWIYGKTTCWVLHKNRIGILFIDSTSAQQAQSIFHLFFLRIEHKKHHHHTAINFRQRPLAGHWENQSRSRTADVPQTTAEILLWPCKKYLRSLHCKCTIKSLNLNQTDFTPFCVWNWWPHDAHIGLMKKVLIACKLYLSSHKTKTLLTPKRISTSYRLHPNHQPPIGSAPPSLPSRYSHSQYTGKDWKIEHPEARFRWSGAPSVR